MKRSEINRILSEGIRFLDQMKFKLPPFAFWSPDDWRAKGPECDEIRDNMLGWDITDFGSGDFKHTGLLLFTLRNGNVKNKKYAKPYSEKILIADENQVTPCHFHWHKMEDIINRGGGDMLIQLNNSTDDDKLDEHGPVEVVVDGCKRRVRAGEIVRIKPGESIAITQRIYHSFWAERTKALLGEVSMVNDDHTDNRFLKPAGRFPEIEEDVAPLHLLANEYPPARG